MGYVFPRCRSPAGTMLHCVFLPGGSKEAVTCFLEKIVLADPASHHIIIKDQAGSGLCAGADALPSNIHLSPLTPYSP